MRGLHLTHEEIALILDCMEIAMYQKTRAMDQCQESGCKKEIREAIEQERKSITSLHKDILDNRKDWQE